MLFSVSSVVKALSDRGGKFDAVALPTEIACIIQPLRGIV